MYNLDINRPWQIYNLDINSHLEYNKSISLIKIKI